MIASPCKDCPDRVMHCHSSCRAYLDYKQTLDDARQKDRGAVTHFSDRNQRIYWRNMKQRSGRK